MEYQLLSDIQRLRRELNEAIGCLQTEGTDRGLREQLQDTRTELVTVHEKLAEQIPCSSSESAPLDDTPKGFGVGGPHRG